MPYADRLADCATRRATFPSAVLLVRWSARPLRLLAVVLALVAGVVLAQGAMAQAPGCQFVLGFKALHDAIPGEVGDCLDNQAFARNGDAQQHTTRGLLVWRRADNWTAFTNGYYTWLNGPNGLERRRNTETLPWEAGARDAYVQQVVPILNAMNASIRRFTSLMGDPKPGDPQWQAATAAELATWRQAYAAAQKITPIPQVADAHITMLAALQQFDSIAVNFASGIISAAQFAAAGDLMNQAASLFTKAGL